MTRTPSLLAILLCLAACIAPNAPVACPAVISRAIDVEVVDALTGHPLASGARGSIRDAGYIDSLRVVGWRGLPPNDTATTLGAGLGRRGTYDVRIERTGFQTWELTGVTPSVGVCGLETKHLRAELTPGP